MQFLQTSPAENDFPHWQWNQAPPFFYQWWGYSTGEWALTLNPIELIFGPPSSYPAIYEKVLRQGSQFLVVQDDFDAEKAKADEEEGQLHDFLKEFYQNTGVRVIDTGCAAADSG